MHSTKQTEPNSNLPAPSEDVFIIIAIPACNEPGIGETLKALMKCSRPGFASEVLILINSPVNAAPEILKTNRQTELEIRTFSRNHLDKKLRIHCLHRTDIPEKLAGAGYARKLVMDQALNRFRAIHKPAGVILSLDADTVCEPNYLTEIEKYFIDNPRTDACSIYFEHPVKGTDFPERIYQGIIEYELHLRYYIQALRYAGHPHAYHTLGSCFAVRAGVYESQGGMNKRKAGEDFYFLHKIIPLGFFHELNSTCLTPSPRPSLRVPFGTGPVMEKFRSGEFTSLTTYHPEAFEDLKKFLDMLPAMFRTNLQTLENILHACPDSIREYLGPEFYSRIDEINRNSSNEVSFRKRFFRWFGIFRVLKYLNYAHRKFYSRINVSEAAGIFLKRSVPGYSGRPEASELLGFLRRVQRAARL